MKRMLACLLCLCVLIAALPALADGEAVYRALYGSEVTTLNYLIASNAWDQQVGANVIDTLVEYNNKGEIIPALAETWETSKDGKTWTFHLRQGVKWYDNTGAEVAEVTANDFVAAIKYVLTPEYESSIEGSIESAGIVNAAAYYAGEVTDFAEVGVKAADDYTLVFELEKPLPYFLSMVTYGSFMPAYGPQLEALGKEFATDNTKMYFCGSYILQTYEPQQEHVYVKNTGNWDAEHVYIDRIERTYNSESATLSPTMALRGEVDSADLSTDILDDWRINYPELISRSRSDLQYSYWYLLNFNPQFDEEYEPANWKIAVNNYNFRHSIMSAFNRVYALSTYEPEAPESLLLNTVTPVGFATLDGVDYTDNAAFADTLQYFYNEEKALEYKEKAVAELTEAGATFPVKMIVTYNPKSSDWEKEAIALSQQIEGVLGSDYIQCIVVAGPGENFLTEGRRAGKYAFERCNWGADYADPETWTDPFAAKPGEEEGTYASAYKYNFIETALNSDDYPETKAAVETYYSMVAEAQAELVDMEKRYDLFAKAEAYAIEQAFVIPYRFETADYQVTKLDVFEGEYAAFGICNYRFKYQHLNDEFVTSEQYEANKAAWLASME